MHRSALPAVHLQEQGALKERKTKNPRGHPDRVGNQFLSSGCATLIPALPNSGARRFSVLLLEKVVMQQISAS